MRIAIIGAGISGLVVARSLQSEHDVIVLEANSYAGGHTHTVDVDLAGESHAIDTGFIVFNDRTYPQFIRILTELGVATRPTSMSFSVTDERSGLEYNGANLNTIFAQRRNLLRPSFYRMLADIVRFNKQARCEPESFDDGLTVGQFLKQFGYSREFADHYLLPMGAAIWSCPLGKFADFPLRFVTEFYRNHGLLDVWNRPTWRVIDGGSRNYVDRMISGFRDRVRLNSPVTSVRRLPTDIEVQLCDREPERYDHVVFACHSDQALRLLGADATATERTVLSEFPYERNLAVLHTDSSLLPRCRRAWASWNYHVSTGEVSSQPVDVTYNMNMLQGIRSRHTFCVTLNARRRIAPDKILGEYVYHHPVFTVQRAASQRRHRELLNQHRTSFCGAYWGNGFHEDGVNSALAVVAAIRAASPLADADQARPALALTGGTDA